MIIAFSISSISISYAWPWDNNEDITDSSVTLTDLVSNHSKKVKVDINLPKKIDDKYASYILYAQDELFNYLKKKKVDTDLICFNYANVIWEKEIQKKEEESLKGKDTIAEYLVCFVYTYADKDKNIKTAISYLLCTQKQEQYANMMKKILETKNTYQSDQNAFKKVLENGASNALTWGGLGAAGAGLAGTAFPVVGNAIGAVGGGAIGAIGGFLYGAGSTIADNFNNDKISINQVISELPDSVYKENFNILPGYEKPKVSMAKSKDLDKYLDEKQLNNLKNATKKFDVNE